MEHYNASDLANGFRNYFTVIPALSEELRQATWRIRHEVYCRDLAWEPLRADGMETDSYDATSVACLMRTTGTGAPVGCVRLILADPQQLQRLWPMEVACAGVLDFAMVDWPRERSDTAEVSRLAVTREFRRRKGEAQQPLALTDDDFGDKTRVRFPYIPVGLFMGVSAMAEILGLQKLLMLAEPRLVAHLGKLGFRVKIIGSGVDHHGLRVPAVIDQTNLLDHMHPVIHEIWQHIRFLMTEAWASAPTHEKQRLAVGLHQAQVR